MSIVEYVASSLSISVEDIKKYISTCPHRYKEYFIPKRNGSGMRAIAQPARELKYFQKLVCERFLAGLPVHEASMAYRKKLTLKIMH